MKKRIFALFCSVLLLVSSFALTCAAKPSDVVGYVEKPIYKVDDYGLEIGSVAYLMTMKTFNAGNYVRYYNCLSTEMVLYDGDTYLSDFTPNYDSMNTSLNVTGNGDISYCFSYSFYNEGGEFEPQPAHHAYSGAYDKIYYTTIEYVVTFFDDDIENRLYVGDISLVKTPVFTEIGSIRYLYGFQFNEQRWQNYSIEINYYFDGENGREFLYDCQQFYTGRFHADSLEGTVKDNYELGRAEGYEEGYSAGCASMERWDFYAMLTSVITAPLTFINGIFNFTVFGVNIAGFVKLCVTALLLFALFKFVISLVRGG